MLRYLQVLSCLLGSLNLGREDRGLEADNASGSQITKTCTKSAEQSVTSVPHKNGTNLNFTSMLVFQLLRAAIPSLVRK